MTERFASSALVNDMCNLINNGNISDTDHLSNQIIATCDITLFSENISDADANRRDTCGSRSVVLEEERYSLVFTKNYVRDSYPARKYKYSFSSGIFSYYKEDNQSVGYMELNENDKTFRYVPRLCNFFLQENLV